MEFDEADMVPATASFKDGNDSGKSPRNFSRGTKGLPSKDMLRKLVRW